MANEQDLGNVARNCEDCANLSAEWRTLPPADPYHRMCVAQEVLALLDSAGGTPNTATRCNEAREYAFACGNLARFYRPK